MTAGVLDLIRHVGNIGLPFVLGCVFALILYFCRLERFRGLTFERALGFLLFARLVDVATFWWATKGEFVEAEINMPYWVLSLFFPPPWAAIVTIIGTSLGVVVFLAWLAVFLSDMEWDSPLRIKRAMLVIVAVFTSFSLVAAATNVGWGVWGNQSPLLFL